MEKLMRALSDLREAAGQAGDEISNLQGFRPKKAHKKLQDVMQFVEYIAQRLEIFFQELDEQGKAELYFEFTKKLDPWIIFDDDEKPKKAKSRKPAQKR